MRRTPISLFLIISCTTLVLAAEPAPVNDTGDGFTLDNAVSAALGKNPELRVFEASIASAKGGVATARAIPNPELSVAPGMKRIHEGGAAMNEFHANVELSQLIEFPGKRALRVAIAERNVAVARVAIEGFRFQLSAKVRQAFYELLAAQKTVELRKEQVGAAQTFVASAVKRTESGYASDFEIVKSQSEVIAAKKALSEAEGRVVAAQVDLNTLMGCSPSVALEVRGSLEGSAPAGSKADHLALAMAKNPSLRTQYLQAETAGLNLRATRFGKRPDFAVGPQVEYTRSEKIYGIGVTVALPLWNKKEGEIQTATADERKAVAEIEKLRLEITGAVTKATANLQVARDQLTLYTPKFLSKLKTFVAQAQESYAKNSTTLIIYLDAKRTYFDTLSDYYEALGKVAACRAQLESAVGVPLDTTKP